VERAIFDSAVARLTAQNANAVDRSLPEWARRSNPIVRRHLGEHWKLMSLDYALVWRIFLFNVILVLVSLPLPFLLTVLMPTVTVSLVLLPIGLIMYVQCLFMIGIVSSVLVSDERRRNSLDLLRVCPRPMHHVLYSKVAAAVWRQIENLSLIITALALFSLPLLIIQYDVLLSMQEEPIIMRLTVLLALASSLIRIILEPAMVGAIGAMVGAATSVRATAVVTTMLLAGAYFAFINLPRLLPMDTALRLFLDILLPLILPAVIIPICFRVAAFLLTRDG
jgi:hypothetical protein